MTIRELNLPRELIETAELALSLNWRIERRANGHTIWFPPQREKGCVAVGSNKSARGARHGVNGHKQAIRDLRRAGLPV